MVSSAYLRLLIFLLAILIPVFASSITAFFMMYSAYNLNEQGDNIQPWHTPFPIWNQSVVSCPVSSRKLLLPDLHIGFSRGRSGGLVSIPISFRIFRSLLWSTQSHHRLNGRESEWTAGVGDGQGGLGCCDSWGRKESDTTELNWTQSKALA